MIETLALVTAIAAFAVGLFAYIEGHEAHTRIDTFTGRKRDHRKDKT